MTEFLSRTVDRQPRPGVPAALAAAVASGTDAATRLGSGLVDPSSVRELADQVDVTRF